MTLVLVENGATSAYFNGNIYFGPTGNNLLQFRFSKAQLSASPLSKSAASFAYPGTTPSVSAKAATAGIVWAIEHSGSDVLRAYDARNLGTELYNSNRAANHRDNFGTASHFGTPMIVNGRVYIGTTTVWRCLGCWASDLSQLPCLS